MTFDVPDGMYVICQSREAWLEMASAATIAAGYIALSTDAIEAKRRVGQLMAWAETVREMLSRTPSTPSGGNSQS